MSVSTGLRVVLCLTALLFASASSAAPVFASVTETVATLTETATSPSGLTFALLPATYTNPDTTPGSPWSSSTTITETPFVLGGFDKLDVHWDVQHMFGPHAEDINPGSQVTMDLFFTAAAAGPFTMTNGPFVVTHPANDQGVHQDTFLLTITGTVAALPLPPLPIPTLPVRFVITSYAVTYSAIHTYSAVPEASSIVMMSAGGLALGLLVHRRRRATRPSV